MSLPVLFVAGASGHLGRRVIELLLERGAAGRIIAGTRDPSKLAGWAGVEVRAADYARPDALADAMRGADRALLISTDAVGQRAAQHANAIAAARTAGIRHVVYTSMPYPEPGNPVLFAPEHYATEQAIKASGLGFTILRNGWYAENLLASLAQAVASGQWVTAAGEGLISHVSREDCARAAAGALLQDEPADRVLTVTGPQAFTAAQIAEHAARIAGKPIRVVDVDEASLVGGLQSAGLPEAVARLVASFDANQRAGGFSMVTNAVETLWGARPQALEAFLEANRAGWAG